MQLSDWLIILATALSPVIAVQVSEYLARLRRERDEKLRIFTTLMSTRASNLDPRHVEALNLIDVVFSSNARKDVEIRRAWKQYLHHLCDHNCPPDAWGAKRVELSVELLHSMATALGYDFDKTHIKTQCYYPNGYGNLENEQSAIRRSLTEVLSGSRPMRMEVTNFPPSTEQEPNDLLKRTDQSLRD